MGLEYFFFKEPVWHGVDHDSRRIHPTGSYASGTEHLGLHCPENHHPNHDYSLRVRCSPHARKRALYMTKKHILRHTTVHKPLTLHNRDRHSAPIQLRIQPWFSANFNESDPSSYHLTPNSLRRTWYQPPYPRRLKQQGGGGLPRSWTTVTSIFSF